MTSVDVGKETERAVAGYLRSRGLAGVERAVRTGYRTRHRTSADAGDLTGIPGVCIQVKSLRPATRAEAETRRWLAETEQQRAASGASVGVLIVRRWGTTDVGRWWCYVTAGTLFGMADRFSGSVLEWILAPVRLELSDLVDMMQAWGWAPAARAEA